MEDYSKSIPTQLQTKSTLDIAHAHRDLHQPVASGSGTSREFRTTGLADEGRGEEEFQDFSGRRSGFNARNEQGTTVASIYASSWSKEDLQPRSADGADVLRFLSETDAQDDSLSDEHAELNERRSQKWQVESDTSVPTDPSASSSTASALSRQDYPYLYDLVSLPEGESISSYLDMHQYTDDVWGLPFSLKRDLDTIKSAEVAQEAKAKALQRLTMLKSHFTGGAVQSRQDLPPIPGGTSVERSWEVIWNQFGQ